MVGVGSINGGGDGLSVVGRGLQSQLEGPLRHRKQSSPSFKYASKGAVLPRHPFFCTPGCQSPSETAQSPFGCLPHEAAVLATEMVSNRSCSPFSPRMRGLGADGPTEAGKQGRTGRPRGPERQCAAPSVLAPAPGTVLPGADRSSRLLPGGPVL